MSRALFFIANIGMVIMLGGCLLPQQQLQFQSEIRSLDQRLRNIEQHPAQKTAQSDDIQRLNNIGRQQANLKAELDSIRVDLQSLTGQIEDQQHSVNQLRDQLTLAQNDLSLKVAQLDTKVASATQVPLAAKPVTDTAVNVIPTRNGTAVVSTVPTRETPPTTVAAVPPVLTPSTKISDSSTALYQQALQLVQHQGAFSQSRTLFKQFVDQYPEHKLAVNAMYWIGETYYGDKQYESAILQFQDVIQKYSQHPKVPAALMKQGLAFYALGDVRNAQVILTKVIEKYPNTPEAEKAQQRLDSWRAQK
ncbi:MAG: tol-pal system protein YbgF [Desulfobacteraceae bacterium 4572_35.1]|nr:MAG: tol-pal system protein YbgF [Desulfobacteraceae bacterium 4572_35.1]